ncbi:MAG: immunoglobulin domain-containing protein, partial [Verrucomicrobiota bacterium]
MKARFLPSTIVLLTALLMASTAFASDRYEDDNSPKAARFIANGQAQDHTLHVWDDTDWVFFVVGANGATNLRVETLDSDGDTEIWLYGPDSSSRRIAYDDNGGPGPLSLITQPSLAPGTYYVLVQSEDEEAIEDGYTLRVSWIENSSPPDSYEVDGTAATAKAIANGGAQNRSIHAHVDIDWVTFSIGPDGASDFRAETEGGEGDTEMWLLGPNSSIRQIVYNDNVPTGGWSLITQATLGPGTYYLYIQSKGNAAAIFYYTLRASWSSNVPRVTKQPISQAVATGTSVTFAIEATPGPWSYQWFKGGTQLRDGGRVSGTTRPSLTIAGAEAGDAGAYSVRVIGVTAEAASEMAQLTVTSVDQAQPTVVQHPTHQSTEIGQGATFTVVARGSLPLAYQWEYLPRGSLSWSPLTDGGNYSGTTTPTLTLGNVPLAMNGDAFRCIVSNLLDSTTSQAAVLVVGSGTLSSSRLSNISILTAIGSPGDMFTLGYVVGGAGTTGTKPLL